VDTTVRGYESLFKKALVKWIRYKRLDSKSLDDEELIEFLLKKDEEIMQDMKKDLQSIKINRDISRQWKLSFEKTLNIIKGTDLLPPGKLINLQSNGESEDKMEEILRSLGAFNDDNEFENFVVIDTYHFSPYRKKENTSPILAKNHEGKIIKKELLELSPFIRGFQEDERYDEYKVRIWFMSEDERKKSKLMEEIKRVLKENDINYEEKTWP
jgi:hypothetical protein